MGNKQVKLGLRVDEKNFCAGSLATGRVYLLVPKEYQADALHLVLVGEEVSSIAHYEHNDHHSSQHRKIERASSTLVHMDVPLTLFPSSHVPPGQYEYPFEWELPSNLKSSMHCAKGDSYCEIRYHLTAYLHLSGALGEPKHVSTQSVCVAAQPTPIQANTGVVLEPEVFRIKSCCWDQGKVSLGLDVDKTVASPDSSMTIGISGANESQVVVECLRAQLVETVSWSAKGRTEEVKQTLAEAKISTSNLPRWQPASYSANQQFCDSLGQTRVVTQLLLPHYARDTYTGGLIQVRHSLIISALTQPCITTPESAILIRVQRKTTEVIAEAAVNATMLSSVQEFMLDPEFVDADLLPDDWRPQEAHVVTLPMSSAVLLDMENPPPASAPDESLLRESHSIATSLSELEAALSSSDNPMSTLSHYLNNPMMTEAIQNLSPREFVQVLQSARRDLPKLARVLAGAMNDRFQCRHVLACLWALPEPVRLDVLTEVAPLASGWETQRSMVEQELDANELLYFRAAMQ